MILKILKHIIRPIFMRVTVLFGELRLLLNNPTLKLGSNVIARNTSLSKYNYLSNNVLIANSKLGNYSYLGENTRVSNTTIGSFTCIGPNVRIGLGRHPIKDFVSIHPVFYSTAKQIGLSFVDENIYDENPPPSTIGSDVWIGVNVVITGGVKIGNGAIIAGGSVVTKDVEPYTIVGGTPAKQIKTRFNADTAKILQHMKWWSMPIDWFPKNSHIFLDIDKFIAKYREENY